MPVSSQFITRVFISSVYPNPDSTRRGELLDAIVVRVNHPQIAAVTRVVGALGVGPSSSAQPGADPPRALDAAYERALEVDCREWTVRVDVLRVAIHSEREDGRGRVPIYNDRQRDEYSHGEQRNPGRGVRTELLVAIPSILREDLERWCTILRDPGSQPATSTSSSLET